MSFAIAATVGTAPVEIDDEGSAAVSYPTFFADLERVAAGVA